MKRQKTSVTSMVLAENKKRFSSGGKKNINLEKKKKGRLLMVAIFSLLFLLVGILAVYFVKKEQNKLPPEIKELPIPKLILSNYTQELYVDRIKRDNLIFETEREKENISIPLGEIIQLYLTTEDTSKQFVVENTDGYKLIVTTKSYLDALEAKAPSSLSRALSSDFVFGYHSSLGNNPFLLFEVKSYNTAFASMLEWEKTMYKDLSPIFVRENSSIDLSNKNFKDIVVVNKDVRAILNNNGKIEFAYSFPNPNTLIIVNNKTTLEEIFRRVTNAQFERKN